MNVTRGRLARSGRRLIHEPPESSGGGDGLIFPAVTSDGFASYSFRDGSINSQQSQSHRAATGFAVSGYAEYAVTSLLHQLQLLPASIAVAPTLRNMLGDTAKVFDQSEPQHDGHRPQLAQCQRGDRLIGSDKMADALSVDPAVRIGNQLEAMYRTLISSVDTRRHRALESWPVGL